MFVYNCTCTCIYLHSRELKIDVLSEDREVEKMEGDGVRRGLSLGLPTKLHLLTQQTEVWLMSHHTQHDLGGGGGGQG